MDTTPVQPRSFPTNLLQTDWLNRKLFSRYGQAFVDKIHEAEVRDDDVWLVTLLKCGTNWMQELLWLIINGYAFEEARSQDLRFRAPYFELDYAIHEDLNRMLATVSALKSPGLIKSHLPLPLLPKQFWDKKPKTVYVYRNPKDAIVSKYYHVRNLGLCMDKTLDEYVLDIIHKKDVAAPTQFDHVTEFYALRKEPWIFYTSYECMKRNLRKVIEDVCRFLNKNITEAQMTGMLHHLSSEEMKKNPKMQHQWENDQFRAKYKVNNYEDNRFIRRGQVGSYKDELSADVVAKLDQWIESNLARYNLSLNVLLLLDAETAL